MIADAVSVVVPVLNGRRHLRRVLRAIARECAGRPFEIIVVDDGSTDGSRRITESLRPRIDRFRVIDGPGRGAAAAINAGVREARYPFVAQVDQDVVVQRGWLAPLMAAFDDPGVAAAQGRYVLPGSSGFWAAMAGRDLDLRYHDLRGRPTDHVCTGNVVYRATALHQAGLFDERLGYGYDNDLSYRLAARGYRLAFCAGATAEHFWRDGVRGYLVQQFGVGYGRLDVVRAHPNRVSGDAVSRLSMMLHAPGMLLAAVLMAAAARWPALAWVSFGMLALLALERAVAGGRAWRLTRDRRALLFPIGHLARDLAWTAAIVRWTMRQLTRGRSVPGDSMRRPGVPERIPERRGERVLIVIPAYNEASSLPFVVDDLKRHFPEAGILVVNDASGDGTRELLPRLGVKWLTLAERLGVGGALRAGLRYARQHGYDIVGRVDGDGQHGALDLRRALAPVIAGVADAATGSRYLRGAQPPLARRIPQGVLAGALSLLTRRRVTDPTSGLWVFGPRALRVLARHHPGGYPEPELRLLLARNRLDLREVPIRSRERHAGRTSLTPGRALVAIARTALALLLSPVRGIEGAGD